MRHFLRASAAAALVMSAAAGAAADQPRGKGQGPRPGSAYSTVDLERCRLIDAIEEGDSAHWRCAGHGGVALHVLAGDGRFDVDAGADNGEWESLTPFNNPPERVEWRTRGGRPFAIIYRLRMATEEERGRTVLGVESISQGARRGCLIAWIDGSTPDANAVARRIADERALRFRCGRDEAARIGPVPR
jgi:opacity protein-like surface antigen